MWGRKTTIAVNQDVKYSITVGHDRYGNLIIKDLKIRSDNLDEMYNKLIEALSNFESLKVDMVVKE